LYCAFAHYPTNLNARRAIAHKILRESIISAPTTAPSKVTGRLDRFFEITARGTTWGTEVRGGVLTFVTMA
jgi:AGZA family xanthine/uracil permease-like MFS transporter